jgi:hypothetical protein
MHAGELVRTAYAVIESAPDVKKDDQRCVLWTWRAPVSGPLSAMPLQKSSITVSFRKYLSLTSFANDILYLKLPGTVRAMFPVPSLASHVVFVLEGGTILLASTSHDGSTSIGTSLPSSNKMDILKSWMFAPHEHTLLGLGGLDVLLCVTYIGKCVYVRLFAIQGESVINAGSTKLLEDQVAKQVGLAGASRWSSK